MSTKIEVALKIWMYFSMDNSFALLLTYWIVPRMKAKWLHCFELLFLCVWTFYFSVFISVWFRKPNMSFWEIRFIKLSFKSGICNCHFVLRPKCAFACISYVKVLNIYRSEQNLYRRNRCCVQYNFSLSGTQMTVCALVRTNLNLFSNKPWCPEH